MASVGVTDIPGQILADALKEHCLRFFQLGEPGRWDATDVFRAGTTDIWPVRGVTVSWDRIREYRDGRLI
jgi:hypothetical protein